MENKFRFGAAKMKLIFHIWYQYKFRSKIDEKFD